MTKEEAIAIIQKAVDEIQDGGFTLMPLIEAQGSQARAIAVVQEMSANHYKEYLSKKPVPVEVTNPKKNEDKN